MFNDLKKQFTTASILAHFDSDFECVFKADSSDHAQENVLSHRVAVGGVITRGL